MGLKNTAMSYELGSLNLLDNRHSQLDGLQYDEGRGSGDSRRSKIGTVRGAIGMQLCWKDRMCNPSMELLVRTVRLI